MRFEGTIDELCDVDIAEFVFWLNHVPVALWHRLHEVDDWDVKFRPLAESLVRVHYPGCKIGGMGLWLVEPGKVHPAHIDLQHEDWLVRIHIPLATNAGCITSMDDGEHRMKIGKAYRFNTLALHAVANNGETRRIHFMFDVLR
jgi:hypothetical protein